MFSFNKVVVHVTDENDNSPQFQFPAPYKMSVQEDAPLGTGVGQLVAFDGDDGMNAQFEYSITHANIGEWNFFNILKKKFLLDPHCYRLSFSQVQG